MTLLMIHKYLLCTIYSSVFITPWPKVEMPLRRTTIIGSHRKMNSSSSAIRDWSLPLKHLINGCGYSRF